MGKKSKRNNSNSIRRKLLARNEAENRKTILETYTEPIHPGDNLVEYKIFLGKFYRNIYQQKQEIQKILRDPTIKQMYDQLVPNRISYEDFWQRYYYRCDKECIVRWEQQQQQQQQRTKQNGGETAQVSDLLNDALQVSTRNNLDREDETDAEEEESSWVVEERENDTADKDKDKDMDKDKDKDEDKDKDMTRFVENNTKSDDGDDHVDEKKKNVIRMAGTPTLIRSDVSDNDDDDHHDYNDRDHGKNNRDHSSSSCPDGVTGNYMEKEITVATTASGSTPTATGASDPNGTDSTSTTRNRWVLTCVVGVSAVMAFLLGAFFTDMVCPDDTMLVVPPSWWLPHETFKYHLHHVFCNNNKQRKNKVDLIVTDNNSQNYHHQQQSNGAVQQGTLPPWSFLTDKIKWRRRRTQNYHISDHMIVKEDSVLVDDENQLHQDAIVSMPSSSWWSFPSWKADTEQLLLGTGGNNQNDEQQSSMVSTTTNNFFDKIRGRGWKSKSWGETETGNYILEEQDVSVTMEGIQTISSSSLMTNRRRQKGTGSRSLSSSSSSKQEEQTTRPKAYTKTVIKEIKTTTVYTPIQN